MATRFTAAAAALLLVLGTMPAQARTARATLIVSATVMQSCSIVTAAKPGIESHFSRGSAALRQNAVSVNCSEVTPYTVKWNAVATPDLVTVSF
jgi:spore coat protein U-like protein